jgi:hypothetical protein
MLETSPHEAKPASPLQILDYDQLERDLPALRREWREGVPYPHLLLEPTYYKARPDESKAKHAVVAVDRFALRGYSFLKRHNLINDRMISRVLKRFF